MQITILFVVPTLMNGVVVISKISHTTYSTYNSKAMLFNDCPCTKKTAHSVLLL